MSNPIMSYRGYVAGWLDSTIHDFLDVLSPKAVSTKYALVTCLDSNTKPAALNGKSPELKAIADKIRAVGSGILVPTEALLSAEASQQIFFGFDEIWFFPTTNITPKPATASLVGPARLDRRRLSKATKWMMDNGCSLGLGSGVGLNFVVKARGLVRDLLGHSLTQAPVSDNIEHELVK